VHYEPSFVLTSFFEKKKKEKKKSVSTSTFLTNQRPKSIRGSELDALTNAEDTTQT